MNSQKILRYSNPILVHKAVDILQTDLAALTYDNESDPLNPETLPWINRLFGLVEEGTDSMPYGWDADKQEHVQAIADDNFNCQVFFTQTDSESGEGYEVYDMTIYIFMQEDLIAPQAARGQVIQALVNQIKDEVFDAGVNSVSREWVGYSTSQEINNNILRSSPLLDNQFMKDYDHDIYAAIQVKIRVDNPCNQRFVVTSNTSC